jgi:hypothetical protein
VTLLEAMDRLVPLEDEDISKEMLIAFKKAGIDCRVGVKALHRHHLRLVQPVLTITIRVAVSVAVKMRCRARYVREQVCDWTALTRCGCAGKAGRVRNAHTRQILGRTPEQATGDPLPRRRSEAGGRPGEPASGMMQPVRRSLTRQPARGVAQAKE